MTKLTTVLAAVALVATVACSKADDKKKTTKKTNDKATATKTVKTDKKAAKMDHKKMDDKQVDTSKISRLSPDELEKLSGKVAILDANSERTRKKHGKIPSATLLSHYADYKMEELPKDKNKQLVFYCSNTQCGASKKGAKRALLAGYTNVSVLPVGVIGWKEAGKKTETIQ